MKLSEFEIIGGIILGIIFLALLANFFWANPGNNTFCGDGICSSNEEKSCQIDCDWCGDSYCQNNEDCSSCQKDCGGCNTDAFCGDGWCNSEECKTGCTKDCSFSQCQNGICEIEIGENCITSPTDCKCSGEERCDNNLMKCIEVTCGNGICDTKESFSSCPNDCKQTSFQGEEIDPDTNYPIIFVHGHSAQTESVTTFSINAFSEFQDRLYSEGLYSDKGIVLPNSNINDYNFGEWSKSNNPVSVRTTYYVGTLDSSGVFIKSNEASRSIKEYGERLEKVVDIVLHHTGKKKVIIIAHSMGGLVSRSYIKYSGGENKVAKLIEIGSPNQGIWNDGWNFGCSWIHPGQECKDMQHDSSFVINLNSGDETPGNVKYLTIAGNCGLSGLGATYDEVIRVGSVRLQGATNKVIDRDSCSGTDTFHTRLISPSKVQETYNFAINFLED